MIVRQATAGDVSRLAEFDHAIRADLGRASLLRRALESGTCLVAAEGELLLGYGVLEHSFYDNDFIPLLYVRPESRRKGVGTALMRALETRSQTPKVFTSTNESNSPMLALLGALGYAPSGVIHNLDPGDPELVFVRVVHPDFG